MAKKQKTQVESTPQVVEQPKVETTVVEKELPIKDRVYYLKSERKPLSYLIRGSNIFYFDEDKGYERELKYTQNQKTPFVDEFAKGSQARLDHIIFRAGALHVPREKQTLQKLLSLYHPHRDKLYYEWKPMQVAADEIDILEMEADALLVARNMDIDMAEAIIRAEIGSSVNSMSSKELKRDLLVFAKLNPQLFLDLANDENVMLRNFGIKATEKGILNLSSDQRTFSWASNQRKLMNVPFDEHPYSALASWFKTDEGMEIFSNIEKRLNN
jgi:hypothetical protein